MFTLRINTPNGGYWQRFVVPGAPIDLPTIFDLYGYCGYFFASDAVWQPYLDGGTVIWGEEGRSTPALPDFGVFEGITFGKYQYKSLTGDVVLDLS